MLLWILRDDGWCDDLLVEIQKQIPPLRCGMTNKKDERQRTP